MRHRSPYDVLGAQQADPCVVIRFRDVESVLRSQGGAEAALGLKIGAKPTLVNLAYGKMRDEIESEMRSRGIDADVTVATTGGVGDPPPKGEFLSGAVVGGVVVGAGVILWRLVRPFIPFLGG